MNALHRTLWTVALLAAVALGLTAAAPPHQANPEAKSPQEPANPRTSEQARMRIFRVSQLMDETVQNPRDVDVGKVHDIVIDAEGDVRYVALSFDATLGFGGKLFAIPWRAFSMKSHEGAYRLVLNVNPVELKDAPGFNQDNWPNFSDPKFTESVDTYYRPKILLLHGNQEQQKSVERPQKQ